MSSRSGLTLTEALIATGIMAIGLISLLALLPVGAAQIAQTFKDDRCGQLATASDNFMRSVWRQAWIDDEGRIALAKNPYQTGFNQPDANHVFQFELPFIAAMDDPNLEFSVIPNPPPSPTPPVQGSVAQAVPLSALNFHSDVCLPPTAQAISGFIASSSPSFPVILDPIGSNGNTAERKVWVAPLPGGRAMSNAVIPRRGLVFNSRPGVRVGSNNTVLGVAPSSWIDIDSTTHLLPLYSSGLLPVTNYKSTRLRMCALNDDLTFSSTTGLPTPVEREGRYSVAWMLQRPNNNIRHEVNLTILTFRNRPLTDRAPAEEVYNPVGGLVAPALGSGQQSSIVIDIANRPRPPIYKGNWIALAGSPWFPNPNVSWPINQAIAPDQADVPFMDFYRVLSIEEPNPGQAMILNLETGIRNRNLSTGTIPAPIPYRAQVIIMAGLAEVFDRGIMSPNLSPVNP